MTSASAYRNLAEEAWTWVCGQIRDDSGPWLPDQVTTGWEDAGPRADRDSLYSGIAGLAPMPAEIARHRDLNAAELELTHQVISRLTTQAEVRTDASLYDGLAGDAT
ncbi:MAG: lanthionine synthetase, partial [Candidatus Nanopelagicales bacterium]